MVNLMVNWTIPLLVRNAEDKIAACHRKVDHQLIVENTPTHCGLGNTIKSEIARQQVIRTGSASIFEGERT